MKFVSWNVNGLRAVVSKGFKEAFTALDADIFCIQETKIRPGQLDLHIDGYESYYSYADRPGYSGTAVFSRIPSCRQIYTMGIDRHDHEGRITMLELDGCYIVNVYTPNSRAGLVRLDYRLDWEADFLTFIKDLDRDKPVIICGDLNVAHQEIDIANPNANRNNPGFTDQERAAMTRLLDAGFTDTFRFLHPNQAGAYSWWSYRAMSRARNIGWRIDYFIISDRLTAKLRSASIHPAVHGSDHCPVSIVMD